MNLNLEISFNTKRLEVRESLITIVKQLHEQNGISLRDIVSEMLIVSSMLVSDETYDINDDIDYSLMIGEDENSEDNDNMEEENEWERDWKLKEKFENSDIAKLVSGLKEDAERLERLNRQEQAVKVRQSIIEKLPEHAETWISIVGNSSDYYSEFTYDAEQMMKVYVVMQDHKGMDELMDVARKLHFILGHNQLDIEIFEQDFNLFYKDISIFDAIYNFIQINPNFQQKNIFKTLSIEGRKATYMLDWAERLKKITRVRYKDTWLLSCK